MYNSNMKFAFIDELSQSENVKKMAVTLFNTTEEYENLYGSDICTFSTSRLEHVLSKICGVRTSTTQAQVTILRKYCDWCVAAGVPGARFDINEIIIPDGDRLAVLTVKSPHHLQTVLNSLCDNEDRLTIDNTIRVYCWLAYSGMKAEQAVAVRRGDVDYTNMVVHADGKSYPFYRESVPAMRICTDETQFVNYNPSYTKKGFIVKDRVPGELILRGMRGQISVMSMNSALARKTRDAIESKKTVMHLNYYRIWFSGMLYRIYEDELIGIQPDFDIMSERYLKEKYAQSGGTDDAVYGTDQDGISKRQIYDVKRSLKLDYERWKKTLQIK